MSEEQTLDVGGGGDLGDVGIRAVAPVLFGGVFFGRVLGVVNDDVGVFHEGGVAAVSAVEDGIELAALGIGAPEGFPIGLMVAQVEQGHAIGFDFVAERDGGVVQE